jgi:hypothetical protein
MNPCPVSPRPSLSRRRCVVAGLVFSFALEVGFAQAATQTVDIIGYAHPPVLAAIKPLREWLVTQGGNVKVVETNLDSPQAAERLLALGLKGHVPLVVLVNGQYKHLTANGKAVEFVGLPALGSTPVPGAGGRWTVDDVKAVLTR